MGWFSELFHSKKPDRGPEARRPKTPSDLNPREAIQVARDIEINNPELIIAGVRQLKHYGGKPTWIIDVVNRMTGKMISLDQRDHWTRRLQEILPERSLDDARVVRRSTISPPGLSDSSRLS